MIYLVMHSHASQKRKRMNCKVVPSSHSEETQCSEMNCGLIFVLQKPNAYVGFSELITTTCWNIRFLHAETTRSNSDTLCRGTLLFSFCTLTQIEIPLLTELTFSVTKRIHVGLGYDVQCISLTNRNFLRTILTMTMNRPFHDTEISVISAPG